MKLCQRSFFEQLHLPFCGKYFSREKWALKWYFKPQEFQIFSLSQFKNSEPWYFFRENGWPCTVANIIKRSFSRIFRLARNFLHFYKLTRTHSLPFYFRFKKDRSYWKSWKAFFPSNNGQRMRKTLQLKKVGNLTENNVSSIHIRSGYLIRPKDFKTEMLLKRSENWSFSPGFNGLKWLWKMLSNKVEIARDRLHKNRASKWQ